MLSFSVSILPLIVIAIVNFVLSWLWYSPMLFANPWAKALKIKMNKKMSPADKAKMPKLFAGAIFSSFALSFVLQVLVHGTNCNDFGQGAVVGLLAWVGFALTGSLGTLWEGRPGVVVAINNGLFLLTYVVFGGILAIWK